MSAEVTSHKLKLAIPPQLWADAHGAMDAGDITMFTGWIRQAMVEKVVRDHPTSQTAMVEQAKTEHAARERRKVQAARRRKAAQRQSKTPRKAASA